MRRQQHSAAAVFCSFDLLELDGEDLRGTPIEARKRTLKSLPCRAHSSIALKRLDAAGETVYREACALGCEGIVSTPLGSAYRSGRSPQWIKIKNPAAPAVRREAEEDWSR